ncbi:RED-like protein N-terminal region-domain-containing protein [Polychytrium aggregatum]|uniref:RED-like protein N-terminal region-domain-containing protein n=1 Tax=Polychytrium aggregatum TaxID=110093 RepID=UPI0022FF1A07|nr:RED-like protein N-terminal region-domain-containing protein [Polychytrium aggregatum]KAI9206440.1 RED-like protein N-terminal region-domain-containing protein [Polychytrium aggregatum]
MTSGLTQSDFKKLLATPRPKDPAANPPAPTPARPKSPKPTLSDNADSGSDFAKPKPKPKQSKHVSCLLLHISIYCLCSSLVRMPSLPWPSDKQILHSNGRWHAKKQAQADTISYRDRAKERRNNVNPDYEESEQMLKVLATSTLDNELSLSYEQSKYLGGDVKHTHLVKGLDYALLQKIRAQIKTGQDESQQEREAREYVEKLHGSDGPAEFRSKFAKDIHTAATAKREPPPLKNEIFFPGRMFFQWNLDASEGSKTDVPTTIIRSRFAVQDAGVAPRARMSLSAVWIAYQTNAFAQLNHIFAEAGRGYVADGKDSSSTKPLETQSDPHETTDAPPRPKATYFAENAAEPEGEQYLPSSSMISELLKHGGIAETAGESKPKPGSILSEHDDHDFDEDENLSGNLSTAAFGSLRSNTQPPEPASSSQSSGAPKRYFPKLEVPYGDVEDGFMDYEYESDEERKPDALDGDGAQADSSKHPSSLVDLGTRLNKKRQLSRSDFGNEQEWEEYKGGQAYVTKAASQYGVKAQEGRRGKDLKSGRGTGVHKDSAAKLNQDFQKLDKIMMDKYGKGLTGKKSRDEGDGNDGTSTKKHKR